MKMGSDLIKTLKIEELDKNTRKNNVKESYLPMTYSSILVALHDAPIMRHRTLQLAECIHLPLTLTYHFVPQGHAHGFDRQ